MVLVWPARNPREVYPSSIGSSEVAIISIWNQWSMRVNTDTPLSSAMRAVVARVGPSELGAPGRVKLTKWMPTRISVPFGHAAGGSGRALQHLGTTEYIEKQCRSV